MHTFQIQGAAALDKKLQELPRKIAGKIARKALRAAAKVIQQRAKAEAPRKTGALARAIKVRATKRRRRRAAGILVLTPAGKSKVFYSPMVEYGHRIGKRSPGLRRSQRLAGKKGALAAARRLLSRKVADTRKQTRPNPFIDRAFQATWAEAEQVLTRELWAGIEQEATR